ncbi:MAG: hypothetical protein C4K60_06645 [Ideonella sp. MAG2]|nr:MAG: hypothetical protein C4K60_06645 [Ideonella sp. MAG2]
MPHPPSRHEAQPPSMSGPPTCIHQLPSAVAQALQKAGKLKHWRKGQTVVRQGQTSAEIVVGLQGSLSVDLAGPSGADTLIRFLSEGELVGIATVLAGTPAPTSIVAQSAAQTLHIERSTFIQVLSDHPEGAIGIIVLLSHRMVELFNFIEMTSHRPLPERVRYALRRLALHNGRPSAQGQVTLAVTQSDMAKAASASRQRVHLELQKLQRAGVISLGYGLITVHQPEALETQPQRQR